jgi:hypothetical protein
VTPDEEQLLHVLRVELEAVPELLARTADPTGRHDPLPGSALAYDDRRASPYQVSHAVRVAMLAAMDHLACLRDSLFHWTAADHAEAMIHTHGQAALVRGALENASRAVWMLEPSDPDERLLRRLRLEWAESEAQASVRELNGEAVESKDDRLRKLTDRLPPMTTDPDQIKSKQKAIKAKPDYTTIVRLAGQQVRSGSKKQLGVWKLCSALAHGDFRGTLGYSTVEVVAQHSPGIALAKITGNMLLLTGGSLMAIDTMKAALKLYGQRAI